ncbi:MAG: hypothetical protein ACXWEW_04570 [Nitrososphaeraceae archaeon]
MADIHSIIGNIVMNSLGRIIVFFKPHIKIISLNKNRKTIPIKFDNNTQLEICIWTIKIHNRDDRKI